MEIYFIEKLIEIERQHNFSRREKDIVKTSSALWENGLGIDINHLVEKDSPDYQELIEDINGFLPNYQLSTNLDKNKILEFLADGIQSLTSGGSLSQPSTDTGMDWEEGIKWFECLMSIMASKYKQNLEDDIRSLFGELLFWENELRNIGGDFS